MNRNPSLQQLTDRLVRVEKKMSIIYQELADLRQQTKTVPQTASTRLSVAYPWADKEEQRHWIGDLFASLSVQGAPMGAEVLQQRMGQTGLAPDELSRDIVEAREE